MLYKKVDSKMNLPKTEEEVLAFWNENKIFEKSLENTKDKPLYVFYDGPPFATGTPHYGHIVASTMKDVVPRYWTMKGRYVPRKWGWDCHGLPIENIVEKELGYKTKKEIQALGVEKFNSLCRSKVLTYVEEWKRVINRLGRWADMENSYKTMDLPFMESVWWVFKELYDKGYIYEGYRSMHICPRCETTLSQSEVAEGYKDIKDLSATVKFEFLNGERDNDFKTYILAWTTTPWTLIGNVALAVGENIKYIEVRYDKEKYIIAKDLIDKIIPEDDYELISEFEGKDLVGKKYKPLFDYYSSDEKIVNRENGWQIYPADFVTTEEGTGVVHIAPAFGEDDMNLGKLYNLPFVQHVSMDGMIKNEAGEFAGMNVKPIDDHMKTDVEIIKYLAANNKLFKKEKYEHSYPHCWRCETPLINYATSSWFVAITKFKEKMIELAKDINWSPAHIKVGRFGNWLDSARDWSISRQRFWASVMPIWKCEKCHEMKVIGSVKELEKLSGQKVSDLHKDVVDKITFSCDKCDAQMKRIPDVLDTWFDSGSMPYAQMHYPFENKKEFEKGFPAEFIAEGIDQTRAWFYYLHAIATAIKDSRAFSNVVVNGIVLAEDGKKMSKRLNNYPDPMYVMDKYGSDVLRYYLLTSPVMQAENLNFKESELGELYRGMFRMLWNSYSFFVLYANIDKYQGSMIKDQRSIKNNLLDRWIISELQILIKNINSSMESYELTRAARIFPKFIDNLSNWYIRRSRRRFWKSESDSDKKEAYETLHFVLVTLAKLMAPFTPFIAEEIYKSLTGRESVHLENFPEVDESMIDEKLNKNMSDLRDIITLGLQERAKNKIKVRQPLARVILGQKYAKVFDELISKLEWSFILYEELNVKGASLGTEVESVGLDINITEELRLEGIAREIIRCIQEMRKSAGYEVDNRIQVGYLSDSEVFVQFGELIKKEILADEFSQGKIEQADFEREFSIEGEQFLITIKK